MRLQGRLLLVKDVTLAQRDAMFALMDRHYENVRRRAFDVDLNEKRWVILLSDPATGAVCGFSTQVVLYAEVEGRRVRALFSGDTIVDRDHWGDSALSHVWGRLALELIDAASDEELYWFLISKGYKTYRFLPLFFREFFPRHDAPTPDDVRQVIDALARRKFPAAYDATAGVVRAGPAKDRLRPGVAEVTPERRRDPHVAFFVGRNPSHAHGDELCCLAPLTRANFTPAAYRVIGPEPAGVGVFSG
jgi:hypothetical protein